MIERARGTKIPSKYLEFEEIPASGKTKKFLVKNKEHGYVLGVVKWYGAWRQYTFYPAVITVFNSDCLSEISGFLLGLMDARRARQ